MTNRIIHPEGWRPATGCANGVLSADGRLEVAGRIGWSAEQRFERRDCLGQAEQALRNVLAVVEAAGGGAEDITRLTWRVTDKQEYLARRREMGESCRAVSGRHFPAMRMVVASGPVEDEALVEIEATALIPKEEDR